MSEVNLGLIHARIRADERMLMAAIEQQGHQLIRVDVRDESFSLDSMPTTLAACDAVIIRTIASSQAKYVARFLTHHGLTVVNGPSVIDVCEDKIATSLALADAGVPTPRTEVAFTVETALDTMESFGYPCVLKPVIGSWGRLLAKIDSRDAAEAILEHKSTLGHYEHRVFYIQEFVAKPGGDIRVVTIDGTPIAAMTREADHWVTNAAKGATVTARPIDDELAVTASRASHAVGGGLLGVDIMETGDGYTVHEVNHGVEFRALDGVVDIDVPGAIVEWLESLVSEPVVMGG